MSLVHAEGTHKAAFRCCGCGHLVPASHAGENEKPFACPVCGAGVVWGPKGTKTFDTVNWEVLADAAPERLKELGLDAADVERHVPFKTQWQDGVGVRAPVHHERTATDGSATTDKAD